MKLPEKVYDTLVWICLEYPWDTVQDDFHLGEILNFVAYQHRADGWGLSRKTGGQLVDSPVGSIAEDILQLPDGNHFDVLIGARHGNPLDPSQATSIGIINLRDRPWVEPVDHTPRWLNPGEVIKPQDPVKPVDPTPAPQPIVCNAQACNFTDTRVEELGARVEELAAHFDTVLNEVLVRLDRNFSKPSGSCRFPKF